jgi:hypothetical protein
MSIRLFIGCLFLGIALALLLPADASKPTTQEPPKPKSKITKVDWRGV